MSKFSSFVLVMVSSLTLLAFHGGGRGFEGGGGMGFEGGYGERGFDRGLDDGVGGYGGYDGYNDEPYGDGAFGLDQQPNDMTPY